MSSPLRFNSRERGRSSSSSNSRDKFNNDSYSRSYSPLLASQQRLPSSSRAELPSPSPVNSPPSRRSSYISSPLFPGTRGSNTAGPLLGLTPTQVSIQSPGPGYGPSASFFLPPPVTSFAYAQTKSVYDMQRSPIYTLQQQVKALTTELQELLDAQSTGLLMNSAAEAPDAEKGNGEASINGRSAWDGGVTSSVMSNRPKGPKISLKAARQGIIRAMKALAEVKSMEEEVYAVEEAERSKNINQVEEWESKRTELETGIKEVEQGEEARRIVELRKEREDVELEIRKVEAQLASLRSRHSNLQASISSLESTLSSQSSSYRHSLSTISNSQSKFFSSLPQKFRSHEVAVEHWKAEANAIREKKEQARLERNALNEGVLQWEEALAIVRGFEEDLKREVVAHTETTRSNVMGRSSSVPVTVGHASRNSKKTFGTASALSSPGLKEYTPPSAFLTMSAAGPLPTTRASMRSQSASHRDSLLSDSGDEEKVPDDLYPQASPKKISSVRKSPTQVEESLDHLILKGIEEVLRKLDEKVQLAESRNWKLLVCCLAAEAQAFREAREIMVRRLEQEAHQNSNATLGLAKNEPRSELFDDVDEGVGLKSKFGRTELGSKLGSIASKHSDRGGKRDIGTINALDMDDTLQNWGDVHDFGGVGLIGMQEEEDTTPFNMEVEMTPMQSHSHSQSSLQDSSSMPVSPKTPSRRASITAKSRKIYGMNRDGVEGVDGSGWDGYLDENEDDDDDDNDTVRGSVHEGQYLKGPTVGQIMRRQGSSGAGAGVPGGSGMGSSGPSGIALGLGAGWGRVRSPIIGGGEGGGLGGLGGGGRDRDGQGYADESLMLG